MKKVRFKKKVPKTSQEVQPQQVIDARLGVQKAVDANMKIIWADEVNFTKHTVQYSTYSNKGLNVEVDQKDLYCGYKSVAAAVSREKGVEAISIQDRAYD